MADGTMPQEIAMAATDAPRVRQVATHAGVGLLPAVQSLLYVLIAALFVITFVVQPIRIPSASMEPTLLIGDFLLMDKQMGSVRGVLPPVALQRGNVVVFHDPVGDPSVHLVKRIIGVPGDRLHLRDGVVYLNGQPLKESYAVYRHAAADRFRDDFPNLETMQARVNPNWWIRLRTLARDGDVTVPADCFFVMGDNRNDSEDSRYWGFVPRSAVVGEPLLVYFSWRQPGVDEDVDREFFHAAGDPPVPHTSFARWERTFRVVH